MRVKQLNRPTDERLAIMRNQATDLLWKGKITTTVARAKSLQSYTEKLLTLAINSYEDVVKVQKTSKNKKGETVTREVLNDGPKKLAARRKIMARIDNIKHPLLEKIFNVYAPKYAARIKETGIGGGYTRVLKVGARKGDNAPMAIIELI